MKIIFFLSKKGYLLQPDRIIDPPIPIYKSFLQILQENLMLISSVILISVLAVLILIYVKKRKNKNNSEEPDALIDPYDDALIAINSLREQQSKLSPKPFVFRLSEILRIYVERVFNVPAMELTGEEFMREIASHAFFQNRYDKVLEEFINQGDRIKYSEENSDKRQMNLLMETALHFVKDTHAKLEESKSTSEVKSSD